MHNYPDSFQRHSYMHLHKHMEEEQESGMLSTLGWRWEGENQKTIKQKKGLQKGQNSAIWLTQFCAPWVQK